MRTIDLNGTNYKIVGDIIKRAINPWKANITSGGREFSDFSQAEIEEYHDFRNGIGLESALPNESARLWWTEGIDFATPRRAVLGPLVSSEAPPALGSLTVANEDMEDDSDWLDGQGTGARDGTYSRSLSYSWRVSATQGDYVYQDISGYIEGATYTFTCYITCGTANANIARVNIDDGVTITNGDTVTVVTPGTFVQATVTATIGYGATRLRVSLEYRSGGNFIYFDDAAIATTALAAFEGVQIIDFQSNTYAIGTAAVYKWGGSSWSIVVAFANAINATVATDATDEYFMVSSAIAAIISTDGLAWSDMDSWKTPDSSNDPDSDWTNDANAFDDDTGTYANPSAADKYLELIFSTPLSTDKCRIYCSSGASGDANANIDFYYDGGWNDVFDGTITGNTFTTKTNAAGLKEVEKMRVESSNGNTFRLKDFDGLAHFHGYMAAFDNRMWFIHTDGTEVEFSIVDDVDNYSSGFGVAGNFGTVYDFFEGKLLSDGTSTLYFTGTEGLFSVDTTNEKVYQQEVQYPPLTNAGNKGLYWNANVWVAAGYGILKVAPNVATFVGPDQDGGLPATFQGKIFDMDTVNNWLVYCVNGGSTDKSSILKLNSSLGGNLQVYTTSATNKPITALHHSPSY